MIRVSRATNMADPTRMAAKASLTQRGQREGYQRREKLTGTALFSSPPNKRVLITNYSGVEDYSSDKAVIPVSYRLVNVKA